jgi:hypothetical protein
MDAPRYNWHVYFARKMPHYIENMIGWDDRRDGPMEKKPSQRLDAHLEMAYPSLEAQNG